MSINTGSALPNSNGSNLTSGSHGRSRVGDRRGPPHVRLGEVCCGYRHILALINESRG
jgi:hypothetical protein